MIELPGHVRAAAAEEGVEEGVVGEGGRADADGWHLAEEGDGVVEEASAGVGAEEGVEGAVGEGMRRRVSSTAVLERREAAAAARVRAGESRRW